MKPPLPNCAAALEGDDEQAIEVKLEALQQASMKLGEAMYKSQQEEAASSGATEGDATSSHADGEQVVDADFRRSERESLVAIRLHCHRRGGATNPPLTMLT